MTRVEAMRPQGGKSSSESTSPLPQKRVHLPEGMYLKQKKSTKTLWEIVWNSESVREVATGILYNCGRLYNIPWEIIQLCVGDYTTVREGQLQVRGEGAEF